MTKSCYPKKFGPEVTSLRSKPGVRARIKEGDEGSSEGDKQHCLSLSSFIAQQR